MKNNKLVIKLAQNKDINIIKKFINLNFKKNHILVKNDKLFKWQYQNKKINCVIAKQGDKLVGIYLYIPLDQFDKRLSNNRHIFGSLWTVKGFKKNKRSNLEKQNLIIALRLFQKTFKLLKPNLDVAVGLDSRFYKFHRSQKYEKIKELNHHFIVSPFIKKFKILDNSLFLKFVKMKKNSISRIKFQKIKNLTHLKKINIDNLFKHQLPTKSKDYLINRYLKHPIYKYDIYAVYEKSIISLCVFRILNYKNTNIIRFVDYVGSNNSFALLKNFFVEILKKYNAEYLDFHSFGIPLNILKKSGLIEKKLKMIIPNYFEPFVNENVAISAGYRRYNANGNVRIFKGDADQDRPSI